MAKTIGFYQNFNLNLDRLNNALSCVQSKTKTSYSDLAECMGYNQPVAEAYSAWLRHTGLVTCSKSIYKLTQFGLLASQYDPFLSDNGTQWLLHYYLTSEHLERSDAWYVFINEFLSSEQTFTSDQFQLYFAGISNPNIKNRSALQKDPKAVLYTYTKTESLGQLSLLRKEGKNYISNYPNLPHIFVIGYMLLDWWQSKYPHTDTLRFSQLYQEKESLGRLCQVDIQQVKQFVVELTNLGYLNFSETQHEPVNRLSKVAPYILLKEYYKQR